jgi:hypothetical protein
MSRVAPLVTVVAIAGLLVWLVLGRGEEAGEPGGGPVSAEGSTPVEELQRAAPPSAPRGGPDPGFVGESRYGEADVRARLGLSPPGTRFPLPSPVAALPAPDPAGGSRMPCMLPLAWRVARVDPVFGLDSTQAVALVAEAAELWERAVGRPLFRQDDRNGFPVRFLLRESEEERAADLAGASFRRAEEEYRGAAARLNARLAELQGRLAEEDARRLEHRDAVADFEARVQLHNREVEGWSDRGGAPEEVAAELQEREGALVEERTRLTGERTVLEALRDTLAAAEATLREDVEAHRSRGEELQASLPPVREEAGFYRELIRAGEDGAPVVRREIRVHRPGDRADLVRILAHELGHAMGLPHLDTPGALMAAEYNRMEERGSAMVGPADVARLVRLCPEG